MLQHERLLKISEYLKSTRTCTLAEIAELTSVSVDTARRDLKRMEQLGFVKAVRGGAVYLGQSSDPAAAEATGFLEREMLPDAFEERVLPLISDGSTAAVNAGSRCDEIVHFLLKNFDRLTVVTNSLKAADTLAESGRFQVIVTGGIYDPSEDALCGRTCEDDIRQYNIDIALLSVAGASEKNGVTDPRQQQADVIRAMLSVSARHVFAPEDAGSKTPAGIRICEASPEDIIIAPYRR